MFNLCCVHRLLAMFPVATCRPLTSLAVMHGELQATILLPLETSKVAHLNTSFAPYSTDNGVSD